MISVESMAIEADDVVLPDAATRTATEGLLAARVDMSGLLAIASSVPGSSPIPWAGSPFLNAGWRTPDEQGEDESVLSRHSA